MILLLRQKVGVQNGRGLKIPFNNMCEGHSAKHIAYPVVSVDGEPMSH